MRFSCVFNSVHVRLRAYFRLQYERLTDARFYKQFFAKSEVQARLYHSSILVCLRNLQIIVNTQMKAFSLGIAYMWCSILCCTKCRLFD